MPPPGGCTPCCCLVRSFAAHCAHYEGGQVHNATWSCCQQLPADMLEPLPQRYNAEELAAEYFRAGVDGDEAQFPVDRERLGAVGRGKEACRQSIIRVDDALRAAAKVFAGESISQLASQLSLCDTF